MDNLETFRKDTHAWLEANCPPEMRRPVQGEEDACWGGRHPVFQSDAQRLWLERMAEKGWTVPEWPREYGGGGLTREEAKILRQELRALGCRPPLTSFGISMLGPALLKYGSEEQKREYLPKITRGEIRWCQGYSEPGAGSDLASLQARAEDKGDQFLVNGSKIWTSYADKADWIFCLVRTDPNAPKHEGISFLLFDMESAGVSTKPIILISGASPFCETFFDDVLVPKANLVGKLNKGWDVAKYLLTHERDMIGGMGSTSENRSLGQIASDTVGTDNGMLADTVLRGQIAAYEIDTLAFRLTMDRVGDMAKLGQAHPAVSSLLKYYGTELNKRRMELVMSAGGSDALEWEGERSHEGRTARAWLRSKGNSIEGGTSEIQLNIIAKRILGLPGA
ncbi:acyl-CoA dehydrogenase family protein [Candidatus Binatus sp.]|jgi:alkylation response protein AidB-like acyl-CoA dehydrogenase|uniref:acyl-CoA dehydrogenase family protein n=1 Tax=Candidatus Binatus sp. TaxID=2811406 RepID=UPI002FDA75F5